MSTRRAEPRAFDHGAPYFVARDRTFRRYVTSWLEDGIVERWAGRPARLSDGVIHSDDGPKERFVGSPRMSAVVAHLAEDLDVRFGAEVTSMVREGGGFHVVLGDERSGPFDLVLFGAPAPQTARLAPLFAERLESVRYRPAWTTLISLDEEPDELQWDSLKVESSIVAWIARNHKKPGRADAPSLVVQAEQGYSLEHLEDHETSVAGAMCEAVSTLTGISPSRMVEARAHRWRYALVEQALGEPCLWDADAGLGVCGDGCLGPRVEDAFSSGVALAGRVLSWMRGA